MGRLDCRLAERQLLFAACVVYYEIVREASTVPMIVTKSTAVRQTYTPYVLISEIL